MGLTEAYIAPPQPMQPGIFSHSGADGPHPKQAIEFPQTQNSTTCQCTRRWRVGVSPAWAQKPTSSPAPPPLQAGPESATHLTQKVLAPFKIQPAMKEGLLGTQHRVMIKCWQVFEGSRHLELPIPLWLGRLAEQLEVVPARMGNGKEALL